MQGASGTWLGPVILLVAVLCCDAWVYRDATARLARGRPVVFWTDFFRVDSPLAWTAGCLVLWVVFFPLYLVTRNLPS